MSNFVLALTMTMLAVAALLTFTRLVRGPTLPDRVIAIDLIGDQSSVCLSHWRPRPRSRHFLTSASSSR